jgi:hypothetical protein
MNEQRRASASFPTAIFLQKRNGRSGEQAVEHFRGRCEILIVLGIGGSAWQYRPAKRLNPCTYNYSPTAPAPAAAFVLDNVDPDQIRSVVDLIALNQKPSSMSSVNPAKPPKPPLSSFSFATCASIWARLTKGQHPRHHRPQRRHPAFIAKEE